MSVLTDMYNSTYTVARFTTTSSTGTDTATTIATGTCLIRPVTNRTDLFKESNFGKEFIMYCDDGDNIREGDVVTIDSTLYAVAGVPKYDDLLDDSDSHFEVRIYRK